MYLINYNKIEYGDLEITKNFKVKEFACKDGSNEIIIDVEGVYKLQQMRDYTNAPIKIISGYRTKSYNEMCGGSKNSYHLYGRAFDIASTGIDLIKLAILGASVGFKGIGIYKDYIHLDTRENLYMWESE